MFKKLILALTSLFISTAPQAAEPSQSQPKPSKHQEAAQKHLTHTQILERIFDLIKLRETDPYGESVTPEWFIKNFGQPDSEIEFEPDDDGSSKDTFIVRYGKYSPDPDDYGDFTFRVYKEPIYLKEKIDGFALRVRIKFNLNRKNYYGYGIKRLPSSAARMQNIRKIAKNHGLIAKYIFDGRNSFFVVTHNNLLPGRDSQDCTIDLSVFWDVEPNPDFFEDAEIDFPLK